MPVPNNNQLKLPPWQRGRFDQADSDPLTGFANIMDVMLVFALGLMLALISQSKELRHHFAVEQGISVTEGKQLIEPPDSMKPMLKGEEGAMEALGQVYRDPKTGKLILVGDQ